MGVLIRHAVFISDELGKSGLITALCDLIKEKDVAVKRTAVATIGELLFYIAIENENDTGKVFSERNSD